MLKLSESLEALQACVINAVWASDIEAQFSSFPANSISDDNLLDRGIARFCQQSAILSVARLFDGNKQASSLLQFLKLAEEHPEEFSKATEAQINQSVANHKQWIDAKAVEIEELKRFRDKQIAHLDKSSVRDHFDGKIAGVRQGADGYANVLEPTVVEVSSAILVEIIEIVNTYTNYFNGEVFDLTNMRGRIRHDCTSYIQYRLAHSKMA